MRISSLLRRSAIPRLTLYTGGPECSLCEVAKESLAELKARNIPFELETVNIRENRHDPDVKRWRRLYQYDIPVLHLDGKQALKHRIDADKLAEMLRKATKQQEEKP